MHLVDLASFFTSENFLFAFLTPSPSENGSTTNGKSLLQRGADSFQFSLLRCPQSLNHTGTVAQLLYDWKVVGWIPGRVIPKTLKMVLAALLLGAQHYESRARNQNWSAPGVSIK